jgi:hypothetical protein
MQRKIITRWVDKINHKRITKQEGFYTMKTIEITISPTGESTVQTRGYTGATCKDASKFIEMALGQKTRERLTAEYDATEERRIEH